MSVSTIKHASWRRDPLPLREAISLWFAISSPLIGVMVGLLGAWFVTWLTTYNQRHPFLAKPVSIPELINAIEQHLPVRVASHVSL